MKAKTTTRGHMDEKKKAMDAEAKAAKAEAAKCQAA